MLKKIFATAVIALSASAANADVLMNGGFETGAFSPSWTAQGNVGITGPVDGPNAPTFYYGGGSVAQDGKYLVEFRRAKCAFIGTRLGNCIKRRIWQHVRQVWHRNGFFAGYRGAVHGPKLMRQSDRACGGRRGQRVDRADEGRTR